MEQSPKLLSNEIRLLNLLPGKWFDPIHCTWQIVSLNGNPKYKALSYVWGRSKHSQPIYLNGSPIHITKHLRRALQQLRSGSEAVCLWVDAVCINQSDDEEKTEQVKMMGKIYAQSQEVVVYLGDAFAPSFSQSFNTPSDTRDAVSHTMTPREYYSMSVSNEMDTGLVWRRPLSHKDGSYLLCFIQLLADGVDMDRFIAGTDQGSLDDVMEALRLFLSAVPWWKRVWVIQEVVIPSKIMILYGSMIAPWETFVKAANRVHENAGKVIPSLTPSDVKFLVEFSRRIRGIESIRNRWQSPEQITLVQLLRQFSGRKATDPRDKVYALLGLAKDKPSVEPNYAAAELDVLADTTLDIISRSGSLDVWAGDFTMKDNHAIPSWIPDWSSPPDTFIQSRIENVKHYNACKNSPVYVQLQSSKEFSTVYEYITRIDSKQEEGDKPDDVIRNWIQTHSPSFTSAPWADPLRAYQNGHIGREQGLEVIEAYYNTRGETGFLRHHGKGVVSLPGLLLDSVLIVGETMWSDTALISTLNAWHEMIAKSTITWEDFESTICADLVSNTVAGQCQRLSPRDRDLIRTWLAKEISHFSVPGNTSLGRSLDTLGLDVSGLDAPGLGAQESYSIRNSIMQATYRRKFFVTLEGRIGLCPAGTKRHDPVCIFPGGRTPFILRRRPTEDIRAREKRRWYPCIQLPSPAYELLGDCYVHKLMDGEAMHIWEDLGPSHNQLKIESHGRPNAHVSVYQEIHEDLQLARRRSMLDADLSHRWDIASRDYERLARSWEYVKKKCEETWMAWSKMFDYDERSLWRVPFGEWSNNLQASISGMREWQSSRVRSQGSLQAYMQLLPMGSPNPRGLAERCEKAVRIAERGLRFEEIPLESSVLIETEKVRRRLALEILGPMADKVAMVVLV
ncbi:hypothetical protein ANOM_006643 [Aspergillus nomiae NRRL 13137]|uniref:Heterokaryon incompatibility domain-containing protein n=1 Tax=Aspergillus nomiae NRRL (strain ATCC 15546 / NRRL 13137 / CBS 260.88 / M93) TaxID=1509407 RepID=A0A0L1J1N8_ASPN3|nr:uncharacterized protein ANOM_006643 [Aspergillus nomiae NRRL 13137]KNG85570.1 hypothetical protein ANOM_006643 [Aspergillus nomiae NRRL 13137]